FHPPRPQTWLFQTNDLDHVEALDLKGCREGIFDLVRDARVWTGHQEGGWENRSKGWAWRRAKGQWMRCWAA
ncbi:MAG: hypothetical protein AAFX99_25290, partial [Myxococcota bacterium]